MRLHRLFLLLTSCVLLAGFASAKPPNLIIILADDLGYGDLGSYGQTDIPTPALDALAARGTRFTSAYAGAPVCAPSRSVLLTGQHVGRTWIRGNLRRGMDPAAAALRAEDITVAEVLRAAGYNTHHIGKWGLGEPGEATVSGLPRRQGFDTFYGYLNHWHAHNSWPSYIWRNETREPLRNVVPDEDARGAGVATTRVDFVPRLCIEEAERVIAAEAADDRPFFLYLAITPPHANNENKPMGLEVESTAAFDHQTDWPENKKAYAALVALVDETVARVTAALAASGQTDDTLILFTSDNGPHQEVGGDPALFNSAGGLRGFKRWVHEGGIRVPAIAVWPGRIPAATSDLVWSFEDILPTFAAAAGAPHATPREVTGINLLGAWQGGLPPAAATDRFLFWEFYERGYRQAARHGDWKAVRPKFNAPLELYFLPDDPAEAHDIAAAHPAVVADFEAFFATARSASPHWIPGSPTTL